MAKVQLSFADVKLLSESHRVIPLVETLFSGSETPLSIFEKLASDKSGSFLLESAQHGVWARYSFIGVNNRGYLLQESDGKVAWNSTENHAPLAS
jgi:anthranilate synthase component 1